MSAPNPFQPWKQQNRPPGIPPNLSTNNSYGKLPAVAHQNMQSIQHQQQQQHLLLGHAAAPVIQSAPASSPSSSTAISSSTGGSGPTAGMSEFLSQLGANKLMLSKLSASYGLGDQLQNQHHPQQQQQQQLFQQQQSSSPDDCATDKERELRIQQIFESAIGDNSKKQIVDILEKISSLRPPERLLLYLRMPGGYPETDPLRQSQNPLGTRSEINHTINWVRSHLEHDPNVSIPKQEVYEDYIAFCERIDIKPLSTADFGKVMKQVFPGIRPRRLGTRGHSRYCYAAMRKATKLAAPKLPDLSTATGSGSSSGGGGGGGSGDKNPDAEDQVPTDEEAWKVIKVWAEAMLPSSFGTINELAGFITKNNLNSPTSIASRQLLQKKLMQRELKERKKLNAAAMKKRRKKRRKTLSTSADPDEQQQQQQELSEATAVGHCTNASNGKVAAATATENLLHQMIKHEPGVDFTDEDNNNTSSVGLASVITLKQQQQSTNVVCDTGGQSQVASGGGGREMRSPAEEYTIFCKKVRQAQQLKAAAQLQQQMPQPPAPPPPPQQQQQQQVIPSPLRIPSAAAKRAASIAHMTRQKRLRLLQQQQQRSLEAQNNSAPRYDELGNLILIESQDLVTSSSKEDFIIPRERVISICNMDKNALDDYLNCDEENSQDQDQELLQYFPEENQGGGQQQQQGTAETGYSGMFEDSEQNLKLSQLRSMLELNMAQSGAMDKQQQQQSLQIGGQLDGFDGGTVVVSQQQMSLQPGSAAASLAMLSQRHHGGSLSAEGKKHCTNNGEGFNSVGNCSGQGGLSQSPNGRRKNCSFVPISAGPQSPRVAPANKQQNSNTPNASPFVSPRNTPIHRKSKAANNGLTLSILQHPNQSGFHQPQRAPFVKNELSASAPPSPSLVQSYRFSMNPGMLGNQNAPLPSFQPICTPSSQMHNMAGGGGAGSLESRSSSVPLIPNYDAYSHSNFTSISQTPVPSECDDFSDPNNILDMLNEPPSSSSSNRPAIKLEDSEPSIADILDQHDDIFPKSSSIPYSSLSRSVPSTPLPHHMSANQHHGGHPSSSTLGSNGFSSKSLFELPKSVPSTPIGNGSRTTESLFQYSPETSRDYLINGNSVERATTAGKLNSFYQNQSAGGGGGNGGVSNNNPAANGGQSANGPAGPPSATTIPSGPSSASGPEMSILSDGIDSFTDALIGSDPLRFL
uniref:Putative rfx dna-binding domain protein n=1 Tax=Culex tarsalis TaxID=7177 RepID=A0A1Q3FUF0_CULTA